MTFCSTGACRNSFHMALLLLLLLLKMNCIVRFEAHLVGGFLDDRHLSAQLTQKAFGNTHILE